MKRDIKALVGDISKKNLIYILGAIGIFLIFASSLTHNEPTVVEIENNFDYCDALEEKLEVILPEIASVGQVKVMVTAKNYGEIKLAKDEYDEKSQTVVLSQKGGGEDAKIIEELYPEIQGVIIVAQGGGKSSVKQNLTEAVSALLGVDAHKIKVFERKIGK